MTRMIGSIAVVLAAGLFDSALPGQKEGGRQIEGWGESVNPDGDGQFRLEGNKLFIRAPGPWHDLMRGSKMNAPRVLRPVTGDFIAQVRVAGAVRPSGKVTQAPTYPFNGAGLLLWQDADNYVRLERAAIIREGEFLPYLLFEPVQNGQLIPVDVPQLDNEPVYLRLEYRRGSLYAGVSPDELRWQYLSPVRADFRGKYQVGVTAINNTDQPFTAELDGFAVFQRSGEGTR